MNAIDWLPTVRHWALAGPPGVELDSIVAILAGVGLSVEALQPGSRYRVSGAEDQIAAVAAQVNGSAGFDMAHEMPAAGVISITSKVAPIEVAGMVIRRTDPAAEAQAMHNAMMARGETAIAQIKALHERQDAVRALRAELIAELDRAGVPEAEARAWLGKAKVTRVAKAAAA